MGIFDGVFNTGPQQDAARAQQLGIQAGYGQLADMFSQGRGALTTNFDTGKNVLQGATSDANATLGTTYGQGQGALTSNIGQGSADVVGGLNNANAALTGGFNTANNAATSNYYAGLSPFLTNWAQANQGSNALADALGLNGPQGNSRATAAFQNNPAYKFGLDQGENAIAAQAQKAGMGASGNALNAAGQFATNYANQGWKDYIGALNPFLNFATQGAGGVEQGFSGLGNTLSNNAMTFGQAGSNNAMSAAGLLNSNQLNLGNWLNANLMNLGNNQSGNLMNFANLFNNNAMNLGSGLNQSFTNQGNAAYGASTSAGNAQANADLAQAGTNANLLNTLGQGAKAIFSMISDEGMKDDIEQVGELYDGQPVVRYRMKGDPRHQIGLIAQKVEKEIPDAVVQYTPHVKGVDYKKATDRAAELFRFMEAA
jgi:Chaperone of endosialidase